MAKTLSITTSDEDFDATVGALAWCGNLYIPDSSPKPADKQELAIAFLLMWLGERRVEAAKAQFAASVEDQKLKLAEQIATFIQFAKQNPDLRFRIARFGCEPGAYTDSDMAPLFKAAPSTCVLPALWRRALGTLTTAQVLIFDPMIRLQNADWLAHLKQYLTVNMPLWGVAKCEFLSIGGARRVSAVAKAAHSFDFKHREIRANPHYYGKEAELASEMLAVWHATHMLSITDVNQTALPSYMRLATHAIKNGLVVDDFTLR